MRSYILIGLLYLCQSAFTQNKITFLITDEETKEKVIGATVFIPKLNKGGVTDIEGKASILDIPKGRYLFKFSYMGYASVEQELSFPNSEKII